MYDNFNDLLLQANKTGDSLAEIILKNEIELTEASRDSIYAGLSKSLSIMFDSAQKALHAPQPMVGSLISGQSEKQRQFSENNSYLGSSLNYMMACALSSSEVNASMGLICAAPTAGACGILPAALLYAKNLYQPSDAEMLDALLVASGVGAIITKNATVSGAEGGCQAECGSAAAMAAAALVTIAKGTPEQVGYAVAIALINCMGLVCDPVAGLVQLPCSFRNASQSMNAVLSADLALAGQDPKISADDAIETMYAVGRMLPTMLRETSQGGIAVSESGSQLTHEILSDTTPFC